IRDEMEQAAGHGVAPPTKPPPPARRPPPPPSGTRPPPPPGARGAPAEAPADATISLDAGDLIEALTGELTRPPVARPAPDAVTRPDRDPEDDETFDRFEAGPATMAVHVPGRSDEDQPTMPPPGRPEGSRSISELIYDDDEGDGDGYGYGYTTTTSPSRDLGDEPEEGETLLHMKP